MYDRKTNKIAAGKIKKNDLMAFIYYVRVKDVSGNGTHLRVQDVNDGQFIDIRGQDLVETALSADQYTTEEKVSKTQAAELLVHSINRPFTVSFQKTDDTERVLRGRLVRPEPLLGRSMVEDLDLTTKDKMRQVDHRTINWLIVDGVKYLVK